MYPSDEKNMVHCSFLCSGESNLLVLWASVWGCEHRGISAGFVLGREAECCPMRDVARAEGCSFFFYNGGVVGGILAFFSTFFSLIDCMLTSWQFFHYNLTNVMTFLHLYFSLSSCLLKKHPWASLFLLLLNFYFLLLVSLHIFFFIGTGVFFASCYFLPSSFFSLSSFTEHIHSDLLYASWCSIYPPVKPSKCHQLLRRMPRENKLTEREHHSIMTNSQPKH